MTKPVSPTASTKYYFYDDATLTVYFSETFLEDSHLIFLGTSDNPKPKMAAAAFTQNAKINQGYTIKERL